MDILFYKLLLVLSVLAISMYLFYKAAGTLMPNKLNLISYTFYLFILQSYIGVSLAYLGDRKQYLIKYIINEKNIDKTYYMMIFVAIVTPLMMIAIEKIFKVNPKEDYDRYLKAETITGENDDIFLVTAVVSGVCILCMLYIFLKIGYIPLMKLVFKDPKLNLATERIKISNMGGITSVIKGFFMLLFIPVLSYLTFAYSLVTKEKRWIILFGILFISSILAKTYNFAKSPLAFYMFVLIIIYIYIKGSIKLKVFIPMVAGLLALIVLMYSAGGRLDEIFNLYQGPLSRIVYTQAATLILHFDLFTSGLTFIGGRSLSPTILMILGKDPNSHVRSGKVVMDFYGSTHVFAGTAGVMNALFIGEAFANYGLKGVALSSIYIGLLFGAIFVVFMKVKKDVINVTLFAVLTSNLAIATQGGFTDFIYSSGTLSIIALLLFIKYASKIYSKNKGRIKWIKSA